MFSSDHIPYSTNIFSPDSFFEHEESNLQFNHHDPFISGDFAFHQQYSDGSGLQYCDQDQDLDDPLDSVVSPNKKKIATSMKDGHSKINTARGPRDRRVRLSIEISRKFFCLQDLLGFDKASKTLDWLLTKSLTAIKDLVEEANKCSSSMVTEQSRMKFLEAIIKDSDEENDSKKKKTTTTQRSNNFARYQLRAEARARARERTKEKLRVKRFDDQETWKMLKDSSFMIGASMGDPEVNDLDLGSVDGIEERISRRS